MLPVGGYPRAQWKGKNDAKCDESANDSIWFHEKWGEVSGRLTTTSLIMRLENSIVNFPSQSNDRTAKLCTPPLTDHLNEL